MAERSERTTIYEVARAGVSPAKISRALREDSRFSEATKQTVRLAASELDYLPRAAASTLALGGRSNALGLVLPYIDGAYYADLLVGFGGDRRAHLRPDPLRGHRGGVIERGRLLVEPGFTHAFAIRAR